MRMFLCAAALLMSLPAMALPPNVEHVETFRGVALYRLKSNGMTILLSPNHAAPVFTFMVVYHVGSRNEAPGNTGSAHLLELDEFPARVAAVTVDQANATMRKHFFADRLHLVVAGDLESLPE